MQPYLYAPSANAWAQAAWSLYSASAALPDSERALLPRPAWEGFLRATQDIPRSPQDEGSLVAVIAALRATTPLASSEAFVTLPRLAWMRFVAGVWFLLPLIKASIPSAS